MIQGFQTPAKGRFAVQLAKWKGAYVIGTASNRNQDFVRKLGADETLDYQARSNQHSMRCAIDKRLLLVSTINSNKLIAYLKNG